MIHQNYSRKLNQLFLSSGFYDTSEEVVKPLDPNFKRLRQDHMDEKRRDDIEEVRL